SGLPAASRLTLTPQSSTMASSRSLAARRTLIRRPAHARSTPPVAVCSPVSPTRTCTSWAPVRRWTPSISRACRRSRKQLAASPSAAERIAMLKAAIAHAHSLGVTGVHAMDVSRSELAAMEALHERGELELRVRAFLSAIRLDGWIERGMRTGEGDDMLRIGGVKFFADGALGSLTAWMREPYEATSDTGIPLQSPEELEAQVRRSLEAGLAPGIQ